MGLSLGFLSCPIDLCFFLYFFLFFFFFFFGATSHCFDNCSFVVNSEVMKPDYFTSILLSQDHFHYLKSFVFPYKL